MQSGGMSDYFFRFPIWIDWFIYTFFFLPLLFRSFSFDFFALSRTFSGCAAVVSFASTIYAITGNNVAVLISYFFSVTHIAWTRQNFWFMGEQAEWVNVSHFIYVTVIHSLILFATHSVCLWLCVCVCPGVAECEWICVRRCSFSSNQIHLHCSMA